MARTIEFEGRLIEVPDDATDDEVATIISATPGPATTTTPAPMAAVDRSVANTARSRLSRRGLTPERIKADPSLSVTPPGRIRRTRPATTDRGFLGELGGTLNPVEMAGNLASDWGRGLLSAVATPFLQSDDPSVDPADNYQPHVPQLVPDLPAIYQEATRRGEQGESLAGMYGSATAQSLLMGGGALTSKLIRGAPARAAAAESQYTEATGAHGPTFGPRPIAREMLDRGMVVGANPTEQAAALRARTTQLNVQRSAIPGSKPVRGSGGRLQPSADPVAVANSTKRAALQAQAEMETNIAKILEAIPETRTVGGAVGKGASSWFNRRLTVGDVASLGIISGARLLWSISHQLVKTNQWRTASPVYKYRFANALMTGDANLAAATGALIASGKAVDTEPVSGPSSASVDSRRE